MQNAHGITRGEVVRRRVADSKLEQKPEAPQLKTGQETPKMTLAEVLSQQRALQQGRLAANANGVEVALEEQGAAIAQTQQTQSNTATVAGWTSVLATVIATSHLEKEQEQRRSLKAIQEKMFELLAKEKEKAKIREAAFFKPLVGILGHSTVEGITQKLEVASIAPGGGLQGNKSVQAQVAQDIAALLKESPAGRKISISADEVSDVMNRELLKAVAVLPAQRPALHVVRPEDSLALKTHEIMRTLATGEERLLQVQKLRGSLGPEKFAAMVDAYDKKYGVPLIAHIAALSSSNPTTQAEMVHEMKSVLSPAQQQRFTEFGRAEFAQVMAVLDRNREMAERQVKVVNAQMREVEKHLAATLGRAELKDTPAPEVRAKLIAEIVKRFPELKGKGFEDIALRLKEVVGERDEATKLKLLQGLTGTTKLADPEAMLELATRTTIHMQKVLVLDQQLAAANNAQSKTETGDEAILRKHYASVFGADATGASPDLARLTSAAKSYTHHLDRRIADPSLSTEQRDALIRERDTIDFGYTKKLVAEALSRETPDPQRAVALLSAFSGAHATTELRRGAQVLETARSLSEAIQNADALRREWQGLTPEQFANLQLHKQSGADVTSAITGRSSKLPELDLATRFAELNAGASGKPVGDGKALLAALATTGDSVTRKQQFDVLAAQREAAQSTKWFSQVLETGTPLEKGQAPILKVVETKESIAMETRLGRLDAARSGMDASNIRARSGVGAVESESANGFVRAENLSEIQKTLKTQFVQKLGAASDVEAVAKVSRELDPKRELLVDKEVLANLRAVADPKSEIGKALQASPALPNDPQTEYQVIKSRLSVEDGVRFDTFIAVEQHQLASGAQGDASGIWKVITEAPLEILSGKLSESLNEARISRVDRLLGALTDEEHQEFLAFFELTTRQSLGQVLIQGVPVSDSRADTLMRLAESRNLTSADVQRLLSEPVPTERKARAEALARALDNDTKRPAVDPKLVEEVARSYGYEYETLRAAASVAAEQGRPDLVAEITEKMRAHESRVNGTISRTVSAMDPSYLARQGVRESLKSTTEEVYNSHNKRVYSNSSVIATTAREVAALLRPEKPNNDAAFNRIRQANLSEEESLYLRALYAQEAGRAALGEGFRSLSGILAKDLEPLGTVLEAEKTRIACLAKGGADSLYQADLRTLDRASIEHNEKRQLETLVNLRASGQYEQAKAKIDKTTLAPAAAEYHKAVSSGDKVKADTADIAVKAKNGDLKPEEVAAFVKDKKSEDFARINKENPQLMQQIQASNPTFFDTGAAKLLSDKEAERKKAVEQVMLKSLTDPMLFNAWLNVAQTKEAKVELLRNLEALVEKQPNAPQFVANNEPKIVQYVRAQKTDFREIDAQLINTIIVSTLSTGQPLKPEVVERLRTLRAEAVAQLTTIDVFHEARNAILSAAKDVQKGLEGYQVWATGSAELRKLEVGSFEWLTNAEGKRQKEEARAKILADLRERYPELKNRTDAQIEKGEVGTRFHWRSGYLLDKPIELTSARIAAQQQLIAPMEGGVRDIRQSRELVRSGFALMAKDAIAEVHRGLSPDATENVMTLLRQRDQKITYKVTDEKAQKEWSSLVESAQSELEAKDRWTNIGVATAKIATSLVASVLFTPAVGLGVAMLWNVGDKAYRRIKLGEDWGTLGTAFLIEAAIDVVCFKLAFTANTVTCVGGKAAKETGTETVKASKTVIEGFWTRWFSRNSVSRVLKNPLIVHSEHLAADAPKYIKEVVGEYAEKAAAKASENAIKKATEAAAKESADVVRGGAEAAKNGLSLNSVLRFLKIGRADKVAAEASEQAVKKGAEAVAKESVDTVRVGAEAVEKMSKWAEVSAKERGLFLTLPPPRNESPKSAPKPPVVSDDAEKNKKLVASASDTQGVTPPKVSDSDYPPPPPLKKAVPSTPPNPQPTPPAPVMPTVTLEDLREPAKITLSQNTPPPQVEAVQPTSAALIPAVTFLVRPAGTDPTPTTTMPPTIASGDGKSSGGSPSGDAGAALGAVSGSGTTPGSAPAPGPVSGSGASGTPPGPGSVSGSGDPGTPPGPGSVGGGGPSVPPASPPAGPGPSGDGSGRGILVSTPSPTSEANPSAIAGSTPVSNADAGANASATPNAGVQPVANPLPNPIAQSVPNSLATPNAQPQPLDLSIEAQMSLVSRSALQSAMMQDALKQSDQTAHHAAASGEKVSVANAQQQAQAKKKIADDEIVFVVHKKERVGIEEKRIGQQEAVVESNREKVVAKTTDSAKAEAANIAEKVAELKRANDVAEIQKSETVAAKEASVREVSQKASGARETSSRPLVSQQALTETASTNSPSGETFRQYAEPVQVTSRTSARAEAMTEEPHRTETTASLAASHRRETEATATTASGVVGRSGSSVTTSTPAISERAPVSAVSQLRTSEPQSPWFSEPHTIETVASTAKTTSSSPMRQPHTESDAVPVVTSSTGWNSSNSSSGSESGNDHEEVAGAAAPKGGRKARTPRDDAHMRNLILQQLMSQHATKAQREKLLKALLALGISEVEYRKLVAKLGEMDTARLAQQQADRQKFAEPVAIANELPEVKTSADTATKDTIPQAASKAQSTRAELYKRLKEEATTARKRVG